MDWYRIEGGMQLVPETMAQMLASTSWPPNMSQPVAWDVTLNTPVTGYSYDPTSQTVSVTSSAGTEAYDMVFNTTAMGPLQRMDLSGLNLPNNVLDGIRSLGYDRATKVAIKFTEPWWTTKYKIIGGVSSSDLPISNVVYPSWNDGDGPAVLMVCYSWAQDATRMGSMVADYNVPGVTRTRDDPLVTLCLNDLVQLFKASTPPLQFSDLYELVVTDPNDNFGPYHAWAWSHDPWTGGAYALFGPGQFQNVYYPCQELFCQDNSDPAGYHFALAGEALSAHHAWICGAFDSAYTTLCTWFKSMGRTDLIRNLQDSDFGDGAGQHVQEWDDKLFGWVVHFSGQSEQARDSKKLVVRASKPGK
jgi:monoamine oxidase